MEFTGHTKHLTRGNVILFDIPIGELEGQGLYKGSYYWQFSIKFGRGKLGTDLVTTSNFGPHDFKRAQNPERFME